MNAAQQPHPEIAERLRAVQQQIAQAAQRAGRAPGAVTLVAVSKTHPAALVRAAQQAGQRDFGENYAQELRDKAAELLDPAPRWHFIGPLQRNKARLVVGRAALLHSIDDAGLLEEVARRARAAGAVQDCLVQVNIGEEPQKAGCAPAELEALLDRFAESEGARCLGLMCIPPALDDAEALRPFYRRLRALRDQASQRARARVDLRELSMGMSHDFAVAIEEGATLVRVGTAIFGSRGSRR